MNPSPPTKLYPPPQKRVPAPIQRSPPETAARSSLVPSSIVQPVPTPGSLPGPPTWNNLKSQRSVPTLLNGHPNNRPPGSTLVASRSNPALNTWAPGPQQPRQDPVSPALASTSRVNLPSLVPEPPHPSSLLDNRPTQPSSVNISPAVTVARNPLPVKQKVEKRGFFARLFGFGKSRSKYSNEPGSTKRLSRVTDVRPMSTPFAGPTSIYATGPTTRPASIATLDTTYFATTESASAVQHDTRFRSTNPRNHAVLVKKSPAVQPTKHGHRGGPPPRQQSPGHPRHNSYPQMTHRQSRIDFENLAPDSAITGNAMNNTMHPRIFNPGNHNHEITPANHIQPMVTTNHTQHVEAGRHYNQPTNYASGGYSRVRDSGHQSLVTTQARPLCVVCHANYQYTSPDTEETSPYCSDVCENEAAIAAERTQRETCSYPKCTYLAVMYPKDHRWNYCSESHERLSRSGCINCRQAAGNGKQLCKGCDETFKRRAPTIIPVPMDHDAFWNVVDRFTESWAHPTQCPVVRAVYKVVLTQDSLDTYLGYRGTLEYYGQFAAQGIRNGNERTLWLGTRRGCTLGEKGQKTPCRTSNCSLCSIIRGSFDIGKSMTSTPAGRFGLGIYTSTKTSKANDYSTNDKGIDSPLKALLLNSVAAGRECAMRYDDRSMRAPPQGYNSVYGESGGSSNNVDELVVYTNDAVRPTWLVMYNRG